MKYPNYKPPKKEENQYQFSFKLKDPVEKTISKNVHQKGKKNSEIVKKRHYSMPEVFIPQKEVTRKISNEDDFICEIIESHDVPKKHIFNLEYFRQVHKEYIAKNGRQYLHTNSYSYFVPNTNTLPLLSSSIYNNKV